MNAPERILPDIQSELDHRSSIAIERVGVKSMVRDVAGRLDRGRVRACVVESENFESIHNHSAYVLIENRKG